MSDFPLHVYLIENDGFRRWYCAPTKVRAWELHCEEQEYMYTLRDFLHENPCATATMLPDDFHLTSRVQGSNGENEGEFTQTCAEWAKGGEGLLFTA